MSRERSSELDRARRVGLRRQDLDPDPIAQFRSWFEDARLAGPMPERMTLATVDENGLPDARMVLLKGTDERGFRFFTNLGSAKADQLRARPRAALVFHWPELDRQVRVRGPVEELPESEVEEYFATRDRLSRLGAWASAQSRPLRSRVELDEALESALERFGGIESDAEIPKPEYWGGYLVRPERVEFWQGRSGRLHDRFAYERAADVQQGHRQRVGLWTIVRLAP